MLAPYEPPVADVFRPRTTIDADGTVEGYASLFGEVDAARDMVMAGAFRQTLALRGVRRIPMLFQHDPSEPVGVWLELREDGRGLYARGRLIPDVTRGRELLALVRAGAVDGLSIGFKTVKGRVDPRSRIRKLDQVDLWEISIVTFPLLAGARVHAVKTDARLANEDGQDLHERLFRRHPRISFTRRVAEREWKAVAKGAKSAPTVNAMTSAASPQRLDLVHTRRVAPQRGRDRIRGWIAESARQEIAEWRRTFAQRAR